MKLNWTYRDCLDLEYLIECDRDIAEEDLHHRDRAVYLKINQQKAWEERPSAKSQLLRFWLEIRRRGDTTEKGLRWPGRLAGEMVHLLRAVLVICLFFSGVSCGMVYFSYSGTMPVNVLPFFMIFVVLQILLVCAILSRVVWWRLLRKNTAQTLLLALVAASVARIFRWFLKKGETTLSAKHRLALLALVGRWRMLLGLYGVLFFYPFFVAWQIAGIAFNLGLLGCSFLRISISDIAFGWQSTLQISAESLHAVVRWIAVPWAWLWGEGVGYPSLVDIMGSHIVLKEGLAHLATTSLVSWWPFLLLSVVVYGLGARFLLLIYGMVHQRRMEGKFVVERAETDRIIQRMVTPVVTTQAERFSDGSSHDNEGGMRLQELQDGSPVPAFFAGVAEKQNMDVLIPDELCIGSSFHGVRDQVQEAVTARGYHMVGLHRYQVDYEYDQALLQKLIARYEEGSVNGIILFVEAWMVPLTDFLSSLRLLREGMGGQAPLVIWLLGRAVRDDFFTDQPEKEHIDIWQNRLDSLGDSQLAIVVQSTSV